MGKIFLAGYDAGNAMGMCNGASYATKGLEVGTIFRDRGLEYARV